MKDFPQNLEEYLQQEVEAGKIDFRIRAVSENGNTSFYIHPLGKNGLTLDFVVKGNRLVTVVKKYLGLERVPSN